MRQNFYGVILNGVSKKQVALDVKAAENAVMLATGCRREDLVLTVKKGFPKDLRHLLPKHKVVK